MNGCEESSRKYILTAYICRINGGSIYNRKGNLISNAFNDIAFLTRHAWDAGAGRCHYRRRRRRVGSRNPRWYLVPALLDEDSDQRRQPAESAEHARQANTRGGECGNE